jgi:hypothetical protein
MSVLPTNSVPKTLSTEPRQVRLEYVRCVSNL